MLRPAQPDDAGIASVLLYSAYTHTKASFPLPEAHEDRMIEHLAHFFRQNENRFSYRYIQVAEERSEVVGLVLSFGGRDEGRLNAAIGWPLEHEAEDDEWYVDALAVLEDWERKGIGTRLLQAVEQQAREHHYAKIALHVALGNKDALSLYQHLQYVVTHETFLYQSPYVHMVKRLDDGEH